MKQKLEKGQKQGRNTKIEDMSQFKQKQLIQFLKRSFWRPICIIWSQSTLIRAETIKRKKIVILVLFFETKTVKRIGKLLERSFRKLYELSWTYGHPYRKMNDSNTFFDRYRNNWKNRYCICFYKTQIGNVHVML